MYYHGRDMIHSSPSVFIGGFIRLFFFASLVVQVSLDRRPSAFIGGLKGFGYVPGLICLYLRLP
jgi:hypothetical protein